MYRTSSCFLSSWDWCVINIIFQNIFFLGKIRRMGEFLEKHCTVLSYCLVWHKRPWRVTLEKVMLTADGCNSGGFFSLTGKWLYVLTAQKCLQQQNVCFPLHFHNYFRKLYWTQPSFSHPWGPLLILWSSTSGEEIYHPPEHSLIGCQ